MYVIKAKNKEPSLREMAKLYWGTPKNIFIPKKEKIKKCEACKNEFNDDDVNYICRPDGQVVSSKTLFFICKKCYKLHNSIYKRIIANFKKKKYYEMYKVNMGFSIESVFTFYEYFKRYGKIFK